MTQIRPMLAAQKYREAGDLFGPVHEKIVAKELDFLRNIAGTGLIMQPKIDGMRCMFDEGVAKSRSWKPLSNRYLQLLAQQKQYQMDGLDGEVISGHYYDPNSFRKSMSGIRSEEGSSKFTIYLFDFFYQPLREYVERRVIVEKLVDAYGPYIHGPNWTAQLVLCPQTIVTTLDEIYEEEARLLAAGWEGGILRHPNRAYKFGRSTALGMELVKVKRRDYVDARVVGYAQRFENQNEAFKNELGLTSRPTYKEGKIALPMLGALYLELLDGSGIQTKCGVFRGLSHEDLRTLWDERESLPGRYCEVSVDKASGGYDSARTPVWIRWRDASEF